MKRSKTLRLAAQIMLAAALIVAAIQWISPKRSFVVPEPVSASELLAIEQEGALPHYRSWLLQQLTKAGAAAGQSGPLVIPAAGYGDASPEAKLSIEQEDGTKTLQWSNDEGWVEWTFEAAEPGLYELDIEYMPLEGSSFSIIRGIQLDGKYPYTEAQHVELERQWKDAQFPYARNAIGHEIRPVQTEITGWKEKAADNFAASSKPLLFVLEAGEHKLRLVGVQGAAAFRSLTFRMPQAIPDYDAYIAASPAAQTGKEWYRIVEAEQFARKSSLAIQTDNRSEPYISPDPKGRIVYNVLGGDRWRNAGEWVEWEFEVPETDWYTLDLKLYQGFKEGFKVYRTIMIDGKVPFQEMLHYGIAPTQDFKIAAIANLEGEPYRFYLEKGKHVLRMTADGSPLQPAFLALKAALDHLGDFDRNIRLLTGNYSKAAADMNLDTTRTWDMLRYDPQIKTKLAAIMAEFRQIQQFINNVNQQNTDLSEAIEAALDMLQQLLDDVNQIPNKINDFATIQNNIGTWMSSLTQEPLLLDYFVVRTPGAETGLKEPTALSRIPYSLVNFGRSFVLDYDMRKHNRKEALTVWVQRGRDYADLLRELVEQDFTPRTGIEVNINLMPNPNMLILGNAAGEVPDVALGVGESTPADYAMRDAVADLSRFPGFEQVIERFAPGVSRAMMYDGGTYGLPEVQNFQVLFYRSDIFEQLHLEAPETWEEIYDLLPTLQENGMTMYVPKGDFMTLFYQHGAEFYSPDGLKSGLNSAESQQAFKQWTDLFTKYNLPIDVPAFFQHFRDGDIPLGIADFNSYVQLLVAAPEITGQWRIAPLPGLRQADGVVRWSPQGVSAAMIMKKSERQEEAWAFLDWWTSAEVQAQYARDMESFYGLEYRWNTANVKAMAQLSWQSEDLQAIREQAYWAKNMPYVPGYYFLNRELEFAWNRVVLKGMPAQESLELAHLSLQREMNRRQRDFGIGKDDHLQIPLIINPHDGRGGQ